MLLAPPAEQKLAGGSPRQKGPAAAKSSLSIFTSVFTKGRAGEDGRVVSIGRGEEEEEEEEEGFEDGAEAGGGASSLGRISILNCACL